MHTILLSEYNGKPNGNKRYKLELEHIPEDISVLVKKYFPDFEILEISDDKYTKIVFSTNPLRRINVFIDC